MSAKMLAVGCALFIVIVALSMTFAKDDGKPASAANDRGERDFARMSAAYELEKLHWNSLDQKPHAFDTLADKLIPEQTRRWKCSIIGPDSVNSESKLDEFEKSAIEAFKTGKCDEQVLMRDDTIVRYALAVRTKQECMTCHSPLAKMQESLSISSQPSKSLEMGDMIGVVSLTAAK